MSQKHSGPDQGLSVDMAAPSVSTQHSVFPQDSNGSSDANREALFEHTRMMNIKFDPFPAIRAGNLSLKDTAEDDPELEATFKALREEASNEAFANLTPEQTSRSASLAISTSAPGGLEPASGPDSTSPKKSKRILSQLDVNELIQMKISQLESASTAEEDEEKAIAKAMKKIHKEISQLVNGQEDHLGKVNIMQRKYLEMFQDMRKQERDHAKLKKKFELLQREKDLVYREKERLQKNSEALMAERNHLLEEHLLEKINAATSNSLCQKLEGLCRQVHRDNRRIKEEVQLKTDQISGMFEKAIVEFKDKVEQDIAEKQRLIDENDSMLKKKFQGFVEQYDVREKHFNSVVKSKDLELQLAQAKLAQQQQVAQQETAKVDLLKSQLNAFTKTEAELRKQLNVYVDKFKQVEETLNKSNALFQTFRKEMEAMSKKGSSLEKVNLAIRAKCDTMNRNILEMAEERTNHQKALEAANMKRAKLENLCRALHAERTVLRKSLDIYEARYPGLIGTAPTIASQNGGGGENGTNADDALKAKNNSMARAFLQSAMGGVGVGSVGIGGPDGLGAVSSTIVIGPSLLSTQNGGIKQSRLGSRRTSITSGKLRQKQKQQQLQLLLQRCEQSASDHIKDECKEQDDGGPEDHAIDCLCHKSEREPSDRESADVASANTQPSTLPNRDESNTGVSKRDKPKKSKKDGKDPNEEAKETLVLKPSLGTVSRLAQSHDKFEAMLPGRQPKPIATK
ncbi:MAG: myosin-like coiled-coil protein-domain-containing protein [Podila humilis]|nr:MAG: myosin-like coiled-coil protein-domain-containing protein [Podila humilis]